MKLGTTTDICPFYGGSENVVLKKYEINLLFMKVSLS